MKRISQSLIALQAPFCFLGVVAALAIGCGDALVFDLQAEVDEFTVPGDPYLHHDKAPLEMLSIPPIEVEFGGMQARSINLSSLVFYVTDTSLSPATDVDTLDFLQEVHVKAIPQDAAAKLPVVEIARWTGPAPPGATEILMTANGDYDLQPYLASGFTLKIETVGTVPYDDVSIKGDAQFRVDPL